MQDMRDMPHLDTETPQHLFEQPAMCAECGLQVRASQIADECELCGAPRCQNCARVAGDRAGASLSGAYICSACAADV